MADANIRAVITADDRATPVVAGFGSGFTKMAGAVAGGIAVFQALRGVTLGVIDVFTDSIKAFQEEEVATARLRAGILNVTSATDKNIDALLEQANALQTHTRFADEAIISAQGILTTFQLNQEAISALTPRLLDMSEGIARVSGGLPDLEGNAMLVAKAIGGEDVVGLVGALRRVGVIMTEHQTQVLTTGNMQERLATITQVLDQNFRGLADAAGNTSAGKMAILQNALNNLQEQFGAALSEALLPFIAKLTEWAQSDQARATIQAIANKVAELIKKFGEFVRDNWPTIKSTFETMARVAWGVVQAIATIQHWANALGSFNWRGLVQAIAGPFYPLVWLLEKVAGLLSSIGGRRLDTGQRAAAQSIGRAAGLPGFAEGVTNFGGGLAVVGERGPELVNLPRGSSVVPNHQLSASNSVNISIQGVFMGTPSESRKLAQMVADNLKDIAGQRNMSVAEMLG